MTRWGGGWNEIEVSEYLRKFKGNDRAAVRLADVEPSPVHAAKKADAAKKAHPVYRIVVRQRRRRLCDPDGAYCKAAIDGLVEGGLLGDDGPDWVESVSYAQEKGEPEETVIELWQIERIGEKR